MAASKRYSAGAIFLQVVPVFADVQRAIEDEAKTIDRALGDQMEKSGKKAGERAGKAASKSMNEELKKGSGEFEREFHKNIDGINKALDGIQTNKLGNKMRSELTSLKKDLAALKDVDITAEADFKRVYAEMAVLEGRLRGLRDETKIVFRADIDNALKGMAKIAAAKEAIDDPIDIEVSADFKAAERQMTSFEKSFKKTAEKAAEHLSGSMRKHAQKLKTELSYLENLRIGVDIGSNQARRELKEIAEELRVLAASDPDIDVRVDAGRAYAELAALEASLARIDGQDIDVDVDVDTGRAHRSLMQLAGGGDDAANSFRSFNAVVLAATTLGPGLIPILGAIAGGLIALGPAAAVGAAGIGSVLVGFSGLGDALSALSAKQDAQGQSAQSQAASQRSAAYAIADAQDALADAQRNAARAAEDAADRVRDAREAAADAIEDALERQRDAQEAYRDSVLEVKEAEKALREARAAAADNGEELDREIKGNDLAIRQAQLDAFDATNNLNAVMADGSSTQYDKEQAQIQYEEAQLRLEELRAEQEDLAKQKKKWDKEGVDGTEEVETAQDALTAAIDAQREAYEALGDAARDVDEARAEGAENVREALEAQRETAQDNARAIADAQERLRRANEGYGESVDKVTAQEANLRAALKKLGPAGREFVFFLWSLREGFYRFRDDIQAVMLPAIQDAISGFIDSNNASVARDALIGLARGFGRFAKALSTSLQGEQWGAFFEMLARVGPKISKAYGDAFISFLEAMATIMVAAAPLALDFARGLAKMMDSFADWAASKKGQDQMSEFFAYVEHIGPKVIDFLGALARAGENVLEALAPWGELVLTGVTEFLEFIAGVDPQLLGAVLSTMISLIASSQLAFSAVAGLTQGILLITSPLGAWVFAIAAVIGILAVLYTQNEDFRDFVQDAWGKISDAITDAWTELQPALEELGDAFIDLWNDVLQPFVEWLGKFLIDYILLWIPILARWWSFLARSIAFAVKYVIIPVLRAIGIALKWLWDHVIEPVVGYIRDHWDEMVLAMKIAWERRLKPTWEAIRDTLRFLWKFVFRPLMTYIGDKWEEVFTSMKWVWDHILKPIFNFIVDTALPELQRAFENTVEGIGDIWETLQKIVGTPIKFVIQTILNDGLIAGYNKIANFVGLDEIGDIPLPKGLKSYATGGVLPGYTPGRDVHKYVSPTGGRLELSGGEAIMRPEWTAAVGPGYVYQMNKLAREGGPEAIRRATTGRYWNGGVLPLAGASLSYHGSSYAFPAYDMNYPGYADYGKPIQAFRKGFVRAFDYGYDNSYGRGVVMDHGDLRTLYAHMLGIVQSVIGKVVEAGTTIGYVGDYGNTGTPPTSHLHFEMRPEYMGWPSLPYTSAPGGFHNEDNFHGAGDPLSKFPGWLVDVAKDPLGYVKGLIEGPVTTFKDKFGSSPIMDIFSKFPGKLVDGVKDKIVNILPNALDAGKGLLDGAADKAGDVADAVFKDGGILPYNGTMKYDSGGFLPTGLTSVVNLTGKPEPVFTHEQFAEMGGRSEGGITYAPTITEANLTSDELMDDFEFTVRKIRRRGGKYEGAL